MTVAFWELLLTVTCTVLATLLTALLTFYLFVIRPWLARTTYLTLLRVVEADLARDEQDGAVRAHAPAVVWLHGQLTRQHNYPGRPLERQEVSEEENGVPTARLVRSYVSELLDAQRDYRTAGGRLPRVRVPRSRHVTGSTRTGSTRTGTGRRAAGRGSAGRGSAGRGSAGRRAIRRGEPGSGNAWSGGSGQLDAGYVHPVWEDPASDCPDRIDLTRQESGQPVARPRSAGAESRDKR